MINSLHFYLGTILVFTQSVAGAWKDGNDPAKHIEEWVQVQVKVRPTTCPWSNFMQRSKGCKGLSNWKVQDDTDLTEIKCRAKTHNRLFAPFKTGDVVHGCETCEWYSCETCYRKSPDEVKSLSMKIHSVSDDNVLTLKAQLKVKASPLYAGPSYGDHVLWGERLTKHQHFKDEYEHVLKEADFINAIRSGTGEVTVGGCTGDELVYGERKFTPKGWESRMKRMQTCISSPRPSHQNSKTCAFCGSTWDSIGKL